MDKKHDINRNETKRKYAVSIYNHFILEKSNAVHLPKISSEIARPATDACLIRCRMTNEAHRDVQ